MRKNAPKLRFQGFEEKWSEKILGEIFDYEQPTQYIVKSTEYDKKYKIPVLTAGKSFILGYTDESTGIKNAQKDSPVIIFDDFTTGSHYVDFPFKVKSSAMKILDLVSETDNFYFMFYVLKNIKYNPESHERHWISKFSNFQAYITETSEQEKIGSFFKTIDQLISLQEKKIALLKEQKKGFLQRLFPKAGAKVPELRFADFEEDWEERKLGDIAERITRKNNKLESTLPLTISAQYGLIDQNEFFNKTVASKDVSGYYLVKNGEFAYNKSYSNGYPWGAIKRLERYENGVLSTLYIIFKPHSVDSDFLCQYYETSYWYKEVSKHAAEGARNHGLLNIAPSDFFETLLNTPFSSSEQKNIGHFLQQIDEATTLQQSKLYNLKKQKKGLLQMMFI